MADVNLIVWDCGCGTRLFEINGIQAHEDNFGNLVDLAPDQAEVYECGDMTFIPKEPTMRVLDKYHISTEEYHEICDMLIDKLSIGRCGRCV